MKLNLGKEEVVEGEFVRHMCQDQVGLAFCYALLGNEKTFPAKIKLMLVMGPPPIYKTTKFNKDLSYYYQGMHTVCGYFFQRLPPFDYTTYYLFSLKETWKIWKDSLCQQLSDLDVSDRATKGFLQNLVSFANSERPLFSALYLRIKFLLDKINSEIIANTLEVQYLEIYDELEDEMLKSFNPLWIDASNLYSFWQYPCVISNEKFAKNMQSVLIAREPYPVGSKLFKTTNLLTLVNDAVVRQRSFVDIIFKIAHNMLMARDYEMLKHVLDTIENLKPWIFLDIFGLEV